MRHDYVGSRKCTKRCANDADCKSKKKSCECDGVCGRSCVNPSKSSSPVCLGTQFCLFVCLSICLSVLLSVTLPVFLFFSKLAVCLYVSCFLFCLSDCLSLPLSPSVCQYLSVGLLANNTSFRSFTARLIIPHTCPQCFRPAFSYLWPVFQTCDVCRCRGRPLTVKWIV